MQLSRELFKQIIAQLKGGKEDAHNKRREPRVGLRNRVALTVLKGTEHTPGASVTVTVRDLSRDGIGFLHHGRVPTNTIFTIRLPAMEDGDLVAVYKVKHCQLLEEGLYRIGGALINLCEANESPVPAAVAEAAAAPAAAGAAGAAPAAAAAQPVRAADAA
jgi:PilZ domain-containing protein